MNAVVPKIGKVLLTLMFVAAAIVALVLVWRHYEDDPWTRDGSIAADVVKVSPDVSGLVTGILVRDNQLVHTGDTLFVVDRERFEATLAQADASVASARAGLDNAAREERRYLSLGDLVSQEDRDQKVTALEQARAQLEQAIASRRTAALDLERSHVKARVNGYVTGFTLRPGNYVTTGTPVFALIDADSFHVLGYFEETKLHRFRIGDRAVVTLLGDTRPIAGHVDSLSAGITDQQQNTSSVLLPNITATFSWIRLAQRVPVRVTIDRVPPGLRLVAGRTASVTILPAAAPFTTVEPNGVFVQTYTTPAMANAPANRAQP